MLYVLLEAFFYNDKKKYAAAFYNNFSISAINLQRKKKKMRNLNYDLHQNEKVVVLFMIIIINNDNMQTDKVFPDVNKKNKKCQIYINFMMKILMREEKVKINI